VKRRTWLVFCAVQLLGWILSSLASLLGLVDTQNPLVMFPVLAGNVLLLPGFVLAIALDDYLNRIPSFFGRFLVTTVCNAIFWVVCLAAWRKLRGKHQV